MNNKWRILFAANLFNLWLFAGLLLAKLIVVPKFPDWLLLVPFLALGVLILLVTTDRENPWAD